MPAFAGESLPHSYPASTQTLSKHMNSPIPGPDLAAVFRPFSNTLWAAIGGVIIFHGLAISILFNKKHRNQSRLERGAPAKEMASSLAHFWKVHWYEAARDVCDSALGFVSASVVGVEGDDSSCKRLLSIGYGFFILVVLARCTSPPA